MRRISKVKVLPGYRLELEFDDGVSGIVDLSEAVGKGVFALWRDPLVFEQVRIGSSGQLVWGDKVDLCPDALYLKVTGKKPADIFPRYATGPSMPEISRFFGIVIKMFFDDHNPPHFHAEYGGDLALIDIRTLSVFSGRLPPRATGLVIEWATLHQQELLADWDRARARGAPENRALGMRPANHWVETVAADRASHPSR